MAKWRTLGGDGPGPHRLHELVQGYLDEWKAGSSSLEQYWGRVSSQAETAEDSVLALAALAKADLQRRHERGESATAAEYLERFPQLRAHADGVLSLVYEEFCLLEENGQNPDPQQFCARYEPWRDSLASQFRYHRVLSQVVGAAPQPRFPAVGDYFEEFLILRELGRGGAARVYLARDKSLGDRQVVLKVSADRGSEHAILGKLSHPNIITVYSVVYETATGLRGLCMNYRAGLPLDEVVRRLDPASRRDRADVLLEALASRPAEAPPASAGEAAPATTPERDETGLKGTGWAGFPRGRRYADGAAWIVAVLARALHYAHGLGVFHRDVKPANVLLTHDAGPQLLDFNLAHDNDSVGEAEDALRGGTLPYMAPEQLAAFLEPEHWKQVAAAADLYSLGLLLRELLTGLAPEPPDPKLPTRKAIETMLAGRETIDANLHAHNPRVPHALEAIVRRCLEVEPARRYPDARALAEDLQRYLDHRPLLHVVNPSRVESFEAWCRQHAVTAAVATTMLITVAAYSYRNYEAWTLAPSQRASFRAAALEVESGQPLNAIRELESWVREEPGSPLLRFYLAAASSMAGLDDKADTLLQEVLDKPEALASLRRSCRDLPGLAATAEKFGNAQLAQTPGDGSNESIRRFARIERVLELALEIDPDRFLASQCLAVLAEKRGQYASATQRIRALITQVSNAQPTTPMFAYHQVLARTGSKWGQQLLASTSTPPHELQEVERLLSTSYAVIEAELANPSPGSTRVQAFNLNYVACETALTVGEIAERAGRLEDARHWFDQSKLRLDLITEEATGKKYFAPLQARVLRHSVPNPTRPRDPRTPVL